jgi:hypothetical protein
MRPLTLDDLLPLDDYAGRRREFFESHQRYLDRYRRVRIGPRVTLRFENRQTLWYYLQELVRIARLADPARLQEELDLYNRLLPRRDRLQAALLIDVTDESRLTEELTFWQEMSAEALRLRIGDDLFPARLVTCRPEDRTIGTAHWVQFDIDAAGRQLLADFRRPALIELAHRTYQHHSPPLSEDIRQSLLNDLRLSDGDDAPNPHPPTD